MTETAVPKGKPTYRRRKILIQPGYQLRVAAIVLLCIVGYSLLLGLLLFYPLQQQFAASASPEQQFWIARQVLELHVRFWPSVLVVAVLVAIQSLFVTHRIVGPAYHLRRVMEKLAAGKVEARAHLRRWDRLKDLEGALNALGESLQRKEQARAERAKRLEVSLTGLQKAVEGPQIPPAVRQAVGEIEQSFKESADAC